jgi:glycine/D-amino acid oxidase-like deaminating enzyme
VVSLEPDTHSGVRIDVRPNAVGVTETLSFDRAVVCAGPWTAQLLPQLKGLLRSLLTPVTYWSDPTDSYSASGGLPVLFNARLTGIYGLPSYEYPGLVKMLYHGGPETDPETRDMVSVEEYVAKVACYVRDRLPGSGFKHAPATGRMLAALALHQDEAIPKGFRADRYILSRFHA